MVPLRTFLKQLDQWPSNLSTVSSVASWRETTCSKSSGTPRSSRFSNTRAANQTVIPTVACSSYQSPPDVHHSQQPDLCHLRREPARGAV